MEADVTILALTVAGFIAPWLIEIIKKFFGTPEGKKALALSMAVSFLISLGVVFFQGKFSWTDPAAIFQSFVLVLGVSSTVYQFIQKKVQEPVAKLYTRLTQ
jgi:hypothetical protein